MEEKNKTGQITFGTYVVIVTIVFLVLLVGILAGMLIEKNNEEKGTNATENIVSNTKNEITENVIDNTKENSIDTNNKVDEKEPTEVKGEKLLQFDNEFYELEDIAKEYREYQKIKNYKDFNYDLDGDGINDKITLSHKTEKNDNGLGDYYEEDIYSVKLNGKVFSTGTLLDSIYIVDLNESDKNIEIVIFDDGPSDDPGYIIYSKKGNKMVEIERMSGYPLKSDKKGTIIINDFHNGRTSPEIYFDYYIINNKIERKFIDIEKIKNIDFTTSALYFSEKYSNKEKIWEYVEGDGDYKKVLRKANVEELDKDTTFKILKFEKVKDEYDGEDYKIYVELSDGRKGYIFHIQWAG